MKSKIAICRILCLMLILPSFLSSGTVSAVGEEKSSQSGGETGISPAAENSVLLHESDSRRLWVDLTTCAVTVEGENGFYLSTLPEGIDGAGITEAMASQQKSQLTVTFLDSSKNEVVAYSYSDSVAQSSYEIRKAAGGAKITYDFPDENMRFKIPVRFALESDYLEAEILYEEIEEYGNSKVCMIDLLPYFGAGKNTDDGYLFVPDGSGALVRFADNAKNAADYRQPVYGGDPAQGLMLKASSLNQSIRLPVFGAKLGDFGFLAVIHQGGGTAEIYARNSSLQSPFASVGSGFAYHQKDITGIRDKANNLRSLTLVSDKTVSASPVVRYYFLEGQSADYSGMARRYQRYLEDEKGLKPLAESGAPPVNLMFYGLTAKRSNFLGIKISKAVKATTFKQAADILEKLKESGVSTTNISLYGFLDKGYENGSAGIAKYASALGGKSAYKRLAESAAGSEIFTAYNLTRDYGNSLFRSSKNYIQSLNKLRVVRYRPILSTMEWDEDGTSWQYLNIKSLKKRAAAWAKKSVGNVMLQNLGSELTGNYGDKNFTDRNQMAEVYQSLLKSAGKNTAAEGGNAYLLSYADTLSGVPAATNRFDLFSEEIPFYAMALHGYVRLYSEPLNAVADKDAYIGNLIINGIHPSYQITAINSYELAETSLNFLYNSKAENLTGEISEAYAKFSNLQKDLTNRRIVSHIREGDLIRTVYEDDVTLVYNSGETETVFNGKTISPKTAVRFE